METQTRFDLNTAIENWRAELAAQSDLTGDMRRELESHLRDGIADLQRRGLNDEEAFWVARKRLGQPGQLGKEFIKANPAVVWRGRLFWMIFGVYFLHVIPNVMDAVMSLFGVGWNNGAGPWLAGWMFLIVPVVMVLMVFLLSRGKVSGLALSLNHLVENRVKLAGISVVVLLISAAHQYSSLKQFWEHYKAMQTSMGMHPNMPYNALGQTLPGVFSGLVLVFLLVLIMPSRIADKQKTA